MTSKIPNPSFIIISSHEQEKQKILQHIKHKFPLSAFHFFENLSASLVIEDISSDENVYILFENCFTLSLLTDCKNITKITSENATIVVCNNVEYDFTQQLIQLGVSEILTEDQITPELLRQSIYSGLSRYSKKCENLAPQEKIKFFDMLSKHYGDLIATVDDNLNFQNASKSTIKKFQLDFSKVKNNNLRDYVHTDDLWQLEDIVSKFENRNFIAIHPLRFRISTGEYLNFEVNFFRAANNSKEYIIDFKDFREQRNREDFRLENNDRFTAIAEATNSIVYEFIYESKLLFTANNKGFYGLIEEEHLDDYIESYFDHVHPDDRRRVMEHYYPAKHIVSNISSTIEYRFLKADGRYKTILDRNRVLFRNGVAYKRVGAFTDISAVNAQNSLIAFEKHVYEMNADPSNNFCDVVAYLEQRMEELIPNIKCMVLTKSDSGQIESVSQRDHNNYFVREIAKHSTDDTNPLCNKIAQRGKISDSPLWSKTMAVTDEFGLNYFWISPATPKEKYTSANVLLLSPIEIMAEEIEITLIQRITVLVGMLVAKNKAVTETRTAKERYELVAKATNDTIWDWNVNTDELSWNKGIFDTFGHALDSSNKTSTWWFSHVHPEDSIRVSVKLYNFLEQKVDKWQDEYRFECADGSYRYVLDRGFLEKDSHGKALRMIGSMQDITQSKKEEERLKLLSAAITQANDAVIITETPRSIYAIPKIVYVNPAFSKMTGYLYDEVVGKSPTMFIGKNAMVEQQTILSKATEFNKEFIFEAINRRKNGAEYWGRFSMIPVLDNRGEHSHWISIQSDITEQKQQEKEKEQLIKELTRHNNDLKQFSYITSHNLRAPLSNLIGLLNLIEDINIEDEDLKEIIEGFSKSTHLLNQTINDLINIVIIKDNLSIERETINIQDIIQNILAQLSYTLSLYSPIITIDTSKAPLLLVNKLYIESIFLNLVTNAIRYSDPDRKLEIKITSEMVGEEIVLRFEDNGVGIDLERNGDKLFGLYQRFHNYPDSKGLGLYLVKSQVLGMGGSISVESELGKGSCFILAFKN